MNREFILDWENGQEQIDMQDVGFIYPSSRPSAPTTY